MANQYSSYFQLNNCFVELFKGTTMKMFIESLVGNEMKKLQTWSV